MTATTSSDHSKPLSRVSVGIELPNTGGLSDELVVSASGWLAVVAGGQDVPLLLGSLVPIC